MVAMRAASPSERSLCSITKVKVLTIAAVPAARKIADCAPVGEVKASSGSADMKAEIPRERKAKDPTAYVMTSTVRARVRDATVGLICIASTPSTPRRTPNSSPPKSTVFTASVPMMVKGTAAPAMIAVWAHSGKRRPS